MAKVKPIYTYAGFKAEYDKAFEEWCRLRYPNEKAVREFVFGTLDAAREGIVAKLMGFDNSWHDNKWGLDHCNGRSGDSAAGDFLRKQVKQGVEAWLSEQAGDMPKLPASAVKDLRAEYRANLLEAIRKRLRAQAEADANEIVDGIAEALKQSEEA